MKNIEIGIQGEDVIIWIDEGDNMVRMSEDETLATAMVLIAQVIEIRKRRRVGYESGS